jgi:hypothetical protein
MLNSVEVAKVLYICLGVHGQQYKSSKKSVFKEFHGGGDTTYM